MSEKNIAQQKIYVLDTNVLIHDPTSILSFSENEVVIPMIVLEELDNLKDRRDKDGASHEARMAIKNIDKIIDGASPTELHTGVKIKINGGKLTISQDGLQNASGEDGLLEEERAGDKKQNDNVIINVALKLQAQYPDKKVCLVTKDVNMRIKAKSANLINVEDYKKDQTVDDINLLPKGVEIYNNFMGEVKIISSTQSDKLGRNKMITEPFKNIIPHYNKFIIDRESNACLRLTSYNEDNWAFEVCTIDVMMKNEAYDLKPKNIHQASAMQVLNDDDVSCVILLGPAGTGKTLVSIASGIEQVLENKYEKIIIAKPTPSMTEDIGFLPGTEEEKMLPWLGGVMDSLEFLHKYDHKDEDKKMSNALTSSSINLIIEKANIHFKSLNYMRGRSFNDTLLIIDEVQSLTPFQLKSIITRVGLNSKIICLGNLAQIDSAYITELTSGLTHVADKLKDFSGASIIQLEGVERSGLAAFAEETL
jgi:PhoH-like ATPase